MLFLKLPGASSFKLAVALGGVGGLSLKKKTTNIKRMPPRADWTCKPVTICSLN